MLDNRYALLLIRGEPWDAGPSIELVYDPELIRIATDNDKLIELSEMDYILLSEEDVERECAQKEKEAEA